MAPTNSKKVKSHVPTSRRSKNTSTLVRRENRNDHGLFGIASKKDKRMIKHSALVSRIEKSKASSKKRRRPSKKLVTTLESLADALPEAPSTRIQDTVVGDATIRHRSLKSRPGAMKRKEKLASVEKDRFNKNMAQMMAPAVDSQQDQSMIAETAAEEPNRSKWAALRGFIQQTLEQRPQASS